MVDAYCVALEELVKEFHMQVSYRSSDYSKVRLTMTDISRPGLQLAGFFDHFEPMRLQILGNVEVSFLDRLPPEKRASIFDRLFSYRIPALVFARSIKPYPECLEMAAKHDVTVLSSAEATATLASAMITYLKEKLAPRVVRHGVLMEIYGEGVLLTGESGIGKSEAAVELLKRGHRLIADDAVEIKKISSNTLQGSSPPLIRNYIELRGIGIVNVANLFGAGAVKENNSIDLVVNIVPWENHVVYDRIGLEEQYTEILDVKIPMNTIPITPGRNLAVILEVAAMNNRQRKMGFNAALEFTQRIDKHFNETARSIL